MAWLTQLFTKNPELAVYLSLGVGYWVGTRKFRGFSLGGTTGSLLAGILIGMFVKVPVTGMAKNILFLLFMFGIGYSVGPKFFKAMKGAGWRFGVLGAFVPVVGLLTAWAIASLLKLDLGFAAGLVSGALTESPAIGTASEAIQALTLPDETKHKLISHIAVADALCYVFGAFGVIYICGTLGPKILRIDLRAEASKVEAEYGVTRTKDGITSAWHPFEVRAYRLEGTARIVGHTVVEAEKIIPEARLFVQRLRRGTELLTPKPDTVLQAGDVLAISGQRDVLVRVLGEKAVEVNDRELLDLPVASFDVFVSNKEFVGRTLASIAGDDAVYSVFLRKITRGTEEIPIGTRTVIERGDLLSVVGSESAVERVAKRMGSVVRPLDTTDFVAVGLAIFLGAALGATVFLPAGTTKIFLGTSVGTLLAGVATGYIRSVRPLLGRVPDGAVAFMQSIGLSGFVAMIGLGAGPEFLPAVREAGLGLLIGGMIVTLVPQIAGLYFGRYVLKASPLLILGALSGAQTFTPGLAAVQEKAGSPIAVLGYAGAVPVAHVLLTTWGSVIVLLMSR
ncbi:MAG TPA: aspartate-alanine antiporter [Verrucomicrobiota bacterium]|nr:aspartate-alanine antiporter [Verrucomicrobiota bacterium]HNU52174.1 aspartate-alanine antiporter [Verrucomicrobiota bacterium]